MSPAEKGEEPASPHMIKIAQPLFNPEVLDDIKAIIESGYLRQGPRVKEFEETFKEKTGARYAYAVNNGTAALHVAYLSTLEPGDEVIVPSFTFLATASMVYHSRAKPVFADIDPETYTIDPEDVKKKITSNTKAVVPVHLFGNAADIDSLRDLCTDHGLWLIHDSAQAHGTRYCGVDVGSIDDLNCYSFYPSKTLTTGEGGMATTNNPELYRKGVLLRAHGDDTRYHHVMMGFNYRLTEIAAVIGLDQMRQFDGFLKRRQECGGYLRDEIGRIEGLTPQRITPKVEPSYSYFSLTLDPEAFRCTRDQFMEALKQKNIDSAVHYPTPLTQQPVIKEKLNPDPTPVAEETAKNILSLPMHPALTDQDLENIVAGVEKVVSNFSR